MNQGDYDTYGQSFDDPGVKRVAQDRQRLPSSDAMLSHSCRAYRSCFVLFSAFWRTNLVVSPIALDFAMDSRRVAAKSLRDDPDRHLGVTPATDQVAFFNRDMIVARSNVKISVDLSP